MKWLAATLLALWTVTVSTQVWAAEKVTVFAAASMKEVVETAASEFRELNGTEVIASFASSAVLAKQIEAGAPAQIFISADLDWMDYLQSRNLLDGASRKIIAGNALIIVAQENDRQRNARDLLTAGRFAMGDPASVPAGKYAKSALEKLGLWDDVKTHAVFTENVRVALQYVSRGEVNASIVYASDISAAPQLVEAWRFPSDSHAPILYPAALISGKQTDMAQAFLAFLESKAGQAIILSKGFVPAQDTQL